MEKKKANITKDTDIDEALSDDDVSSSVDDRRVFGAGAPERLLQGAKVGDAPDGRVLKEYGEPIEFDPSFRGPIKNRSCTDIICCFIFVVFIVGMIAISIIGYARGNPYRLLYPTDSQGAICGLDKHKDKPHLFFFDLVTCASMGPAIVTGCPTPQICVEKCPTENYVFQQSVPTNNRSKLICKYGIDPTATPYNEMDIKQLVEQNLCAAYYLISESTFGRCIPTIANALDSSDELSDASGALLVRANGNAITGGLIKNGTSKLMQFFKLKGTAELLLNDVVNSAHLISIYIGLAVVLAMIWIVLLRWITTVMVWLSIALFVALFGFGTFYSYSKYYELKKMNVTSEFSLPTDFEFDFDYFLTLKYTWLAFGCTAATILCIFIIIILFMYSRIMLATKLISEASVAISHMWCVLFWPLVPFVLQILVTVYWISSMVYLATMGEPEFNNATNEVNALLQKVSCDPNTYDSLGELCSFVKYGGDTYKIPLMFFMLFMFFWLINFIIALQQMTLAGAFASYYWAWDKSKDIPAFPLASSFYRCIRYHLGSLAFGSLIIASVQLIRSLLDYISRNVKGANNVVAKFILKCLSCCFWCLEKFLRLVNKNAFIIIAVHGGNFCSGAKDGFFLLMRNILRAAVLDKVCDFIMFVSKLMITGGICVLAVFSYQGKIPFIVEVVPSLNYFLTPVIVTGIGTYLIADCFFDVYSLAVDTIFVCFLEDMERNDGSAERPYFIGSDSNLRSLLSKTKKK